MKRLFQIIFIFAFVVIGAVLLVPMFLSLETVKQEILLKAREATGWQIEIKGGISLSLFPTASVSLSDVAMTGDAITTDAPFATLQSLDIGIAVLPLLQGQYQLTGIEISRPVLMLARFDNGTTNWQSAKSDTKTSTDGETQAGSDGPDFDPKTISIGEITLQGGSLSYVDHGTGQKIELQEITIDALVASLAEPITTNISFNYKGQRQDLSIEVANPPAILDGDVSHLRLAARNSSANFSADGLLFVAEKNFEGNIDFISPDLPGLGRNIGVEIPQNPLFPSLSLKSKIRTHEAGVDLTDLSGSAGNHNFSGRLAYDQSDAKPKIIAAINLNKLDLDMVQAPSSETQTAQESPDKANNSSEPLNLSFLQDFETALQISISGLKQGNVALNDISIAMTGKDGVARVELQPLAFSDGTARGTIDIDARQKEIKLTADLKADNLDLDQIKNLTSQDLPVIGRLSANLKAASNGTSLTALRNSLVLRGNLSLADGSATLPQLRAIAGPSVGDRADSLAKLSLRAAFSGQDEPADIQLAASWLGEAFSLQTKVIPRSLTSGSPSPITLVFRRANDVAQFSGTVDSKNAQAEGHIDVASPSLRNLLAWLRRPVPEGPGYQAFRLKGQLKADAKLVSFSQLEVGLDQTQGVLTGSIDQTQTLPDINLSGKFATLDLTPYLAGEKSPSANASSSSAPLKQTERGWSLESIDTHLFKNANAKLALSVDRFIYDRLLVETIGLTGSLRNGTMTADLNRMSLYGGSGRGKISLQARDDALAADLQFTAEGVDGRPFVSALSKHDWLEGTGTLSMNLQSLGAHPAGLISSLTGKTDFKFVDGALRGINIARLMRGLTTDILNGWQNSDTEKTDFAELSTTCDIQNGIAQCNQLQMFGPLVRLTGSGVTDMPRKHLRWRVDPKLVASLQGQGANDLAGFHVPIVIDGPWERPRIYPDIEGILQNPQAALTQLRGTSGAIMQLFGKDKETATKAIDKVLEKVGGEDVGNVLNQILRPQNQPPADQQQDEKTDLEEGINLFRRFLK